MDIEACPIPEDAFLRSDVPAASTRTATRPWSPGSSRSPSMSKRFTPRRSSARGRRRILQWFVSKPSTETDIRELAEGSRLTRSRRWKVERRSADQLLLGDLHGPHGTPADDPRGERAGTQLYFGSAVVPVTDRKTGETSLGLGFQSLLGFHKLRRGRRRARPGRGWRRRATARASACRTRPVHHDAAAVAGAHRRGLAAPGSDRLLRPGTLPRCRASSTPGRISRAYGIALARSPIVQPLAIHYGHRGLHRVLGRTSPLLRAVVVGFVGLAHSTMHGKTGMAAAVDAYFSDVRVGARQSLCRLLCPRPAHTEERVGAFALHGLHGAGGSRSDRPSHRRACDVASRSQLPAPTFGLMGVAARAHRVGAARWRGQLRLSARARCIRHRRPASPALDFHTWGWPWQQWKALAAAFAALPMP